MSEPEASEEYFAIALEKRVMDVWMEFKKQQNCESHTDVAWLLLNYWKDKNSEFENSSEDVVEISPRTKGTDITTKSTNMPNKSDALNLAKTLKTNQVIVSENKASSILEKIGKGVCKNAEVPVVAKKDLTISENSSFDISTDECVKNFEKSAQKSIPIGKNTQITRKICPHSESAVVEKEEKTDLRPNFDDIVYEVRTQKRKGPKTDAVCQTSDNVARETHGQIKVRIIHLSGKRSVSKHIDYIKALEKVENSLKISENAKQNSPQLGVKIVRNSENTNQNSSGQGVEIGQSSGIANQNSSGQGVENGQSSGNANQNSSGRVEIGQSSGNTNQNSSGQVKIVQSSENTNQNSSGRVEIVQSSGNTNQNSSGQGVEIGQSSENANQNSSGQVEIVQSSGNANQNSSGQGVEIGQNSGKCANVEKQDSECLISDDSEGDVDEIEIFKNSENSVSETESTMEISNQTIQQTEKSDNDKPYPCAVLVKTVSDSDPLRHPITSDHNYVVPVRTARVDVDRGSMGSQNENESMGTLPQPQNRSKGTQLKNQSLGSQNEIESMGISTQLKKGSMVIQTQNENESSGIQLQNRSKGIQLQKKTKGTQPQNGSMVVQTQNESKGPQKRSMVVQTQKKTQGTQPQHGSMVVQTQNESKVIIPQPQSRSMALQTQKETKGTQPQNGSTGTQASQASKLPVPKETKEQQVEIESMDIHESESLVPQLKNGSLVTQTLIGFKGTQKKITPVMSKTGPKDPQTDTICSKSRSVDASENLHDNLSAADNSITSPDQHYHLSEDADTMPYKERLKLLKNKKGGSQTDRVGEKQKDLSGKKNAHGPYRNTFKRTMKLIVRPNRPVLKESRGCGPDKFAAPNVPMSGKSDKSSKSAEFIAPDNVSLDSDSNAEEIERPSLPMSTETNNLLTQKVNLLPKSQGDRAVNSVSSLKSSSPKSCSPKSSSKLKPPTVQKKPPASNDSLGIGNDLQVKDKEAASFRKESSTTTKPGIESTTATKPGIDCPTSTKQLETKETASMNTEITDLEELLPITEDTIETMSPTTDQAPLTVKKKPQKKPKGKKRRKQTSNKKEKLLPPGDDSEIPNQPTKTTTAKKTKMSCDASIVIQAPIDVQPLLRNFDKPFKCEFCWKSFIRQSTRDQHQKTHITEYQCPRFCDKSFPTLKDLNEHMKMNHREPRCWKCIVCNMTFFTKYLLKAHQQRFPDNHSRCEQCSKIFSTDEMLNHIREHKGEKLHQCEDCGKMFLTRHQLNCHFKATHVTTVKRAPRQKLPCTLCKRLFATLKNLEHHQKFYNHDRQKFKCEICDKEFPNSNQRNAHMRSHTGEKPFECDICHKRFPYNCLKGHMRIHTGEKPFQCDYCDKRFTIGGNKKLHMRNMHKDELKLTKLLAEAEKNEPNADTNMSQNETMTSVMNLDLTEDSSMETDMQSVPKVVIQNNPMWEFTDASSLHKNYE